MKLSIQLGVVKSIISMNLDNSIVIFYYRVVIFFVYILFIQFHKK